MNKISETHIAGLIAWRLSPLLDVVQYGELLKRLGEPANLFDNLNNLSELPLLAARLSKSAYRQEIRATLIEWQRQGIGVVVLGESSYPEQLMNIPDPPLLLTYRGTWKPENRLLPHISVVGSRRADPEGIEIAEHFSSYLAQQGACVVSGLALGVDGAAHRGAIRARRVADNYLPTIAVCGNGLMHVYPRSHSTLAKDILDRGGILLSQFDPQEPAYPVNFLNRNRIIAALSLGTLVVQASDKSGSLVTARHAIEYGKELFIVPGSIMDPRYLGSNRLLQHGAHLVTNPEDLIDLIPELANLPRGKGTACAPQIAPGSRWIIEQLTGQSPLSIDLLIEKSPDPAKFFEQILLLELKGIIARLPGNFVTLSTSQRLAPIG